MKKLTLVVLFIGCVLALTRTASAQEVPYYGACRDGLFFREDVIDLVSSNIQSIFIGSSVTNWKLKEATLYGNPNDPTAPGVYLLKTAKPLKVGRKIVMWAKIDEKTWLPAALMDYEIFQDGDIISNGQTGENAGFNIQCIVLDLSFLK